MTTGDPPELLSRSTGEADPPDDAPKLPIEERAKAHALEYLRAVAEPGQVVELRALGCPKYPSKRHGYFDDMGALATAAIQASFAFNAELVALTINPVETVLLARAKNTFVKCEHATSDEHITRRCFLFVDTDPDRPAGIASSNSEHDAALALAKHIQEELSRLGFPEPILSDSGNGSHLLYRVDLPNDEASLSLVACTLTTLDQMFSTPEVKVDRSTGNAARLCRLPGTVNRKGSHTEDRPHRFARWLSLPDKLEVVPAELLRELCDAASRAVTSGPGRSPQDRAPVAAPAKSAAHGFDDNIQLIGDFLRENALEHQGPDTWKGGQLWKLRECPFDDHGENYKAHVAVLPSGAFSAGCRKDGCSGFGWAEVKKRYSPWFEGRAKNRRNARSRDKRAEVRESKREVQERSAAATCALEAYAKVCHRRLLSRSDALGFLTGRGISKDAVERFRIGWSEGKDAIPEFVEELTRGGVDHGQLVASGAFECSSGDNPPTPMVAGRLTFPCAVDDTLVAVLAVSTPWSDDQLAEAAVVELRPDTKACPDHPASLWSGVDLGQDIETLLVFADPLDAAALCAAGRHAISVANWQQLPLVRSSLESPEMVVIALPHPLARDIREARKAASALEHYGVPSRLVDLPLHAETRNAIAQAIGENELASIEEIDLLSRHDALQRVLVAKLNRPGFAGDLAT